MVVTWCIMAFVPSNDCVLVPGMCLCLMSM